MNILHRPQAVHPASAQQFVFYGAKWAAYDKILEIVGSHRIRVSYDRGKLELMSPLQVHEVYKTLFGRLFDALMTELDIPMKALGSTTFRREDVEGGLEPDQCYYFASAARVRSWWTLDLAIDPPPDLAIEIEITNSATDRMHIYAGLRIPEVWRFNGEHLIVHRLRRDGGYRVAPRSVELPFVPLDEIPPLFQRSMEIQEDRALLRGLREWVRTRVAPLHQSWAAKPRRRRTDG